MSPSHIILHQFAVRQSFNPGCCIYAFILFKNTLPFFNPFDNRSIHSQMAMSPSHIILRMFSPVHTVGLNVSTSFTSRSLSFNLYFSFLMWLLPAGSFSHWVFDAPATEHFISALLHTTYLYFYLYVCHLKRCP
ncbi:hypothetical protein L208DRAFT_743394 [Tricholoma matsutake]|nr:hypothetical protein L208DRAFT_743394 [Tricholoma matsutake 945]